MAAIIKAVEEKKLDAEIKAVISNNPDAPGLAIAAQHGIPSFCVRPGMYSDNSSYENAILAILRESQVRLLVCAGYMKILGPTLLQAFPNAIVNIHPSLLPAFKGLNAQKKAIEYGVRFSGCTVHYVTGQLDGGPIILQEVVPVYQDDTEDTLSERILPKEHEIYPKALQLIAENRIRIEKNKVRILEKET